MDQQQVDVLQAEPLEALLEARDRTILALKFPVELRRHKQFVAGDARPTDALADALLVAVPHGGVDVAVADLDGRRDGARGLFALERVGAESDLRDAAAVVELECGDHPLRLCPG